MQISGISSLLLSESLFTLYPTIVKKTQLILPYQILNRFVIYTIVGLIFSWRFISLSELLSINTLLLTLTNMIHIANAYFAYHKLPSGIAQTLFYTYPIFIAIFVGGISPKNFAYLFISLLSTYLLNGNNVEKETEQTEGKTKYYVAIIIAAITEALLYILIRRINHGNIWYKMFLTYVFGAILLCIGLYIYGYYTQQNIIDEILSAPFLKLSGINAFIATVADYLRFFAIINLDVMTYAIMSYYGVILSYIYGYMFNNERITINNIIGSIIIVSVSIASIKF